MKLSEFHIEDIFSAVREGSSPGTWSKGVEISRKNVISQQNLSREEISLVALNKETGVSSVIKLFSQDNDWNCDCGSEDDPCCHVAACLIAIKRAQEKGEELPQAEKANSTLQYRFSRQNGELKFGRFIVENTKEVPFKTPLSTLINEVKSHSFNIDGITFSPLTVTKEDLEAEVALGYDREGCLSRDTIPKLFKALEAKNQAFLDGQPIKTGSDPICLKAVIIDESPGFRLFGEQESGILEVFRNGAALCDGVLRAIKLPSLNIQEEQWLKEGRFFARSEVAFLVGEVIPSLENKLKVEIRTKNLPCSTLEKPRLQLDMKTIAENLEITAEIVYGNPVQARIREGRFVVLGAMVPERNMNEELKLKDLLWQSLGMELDQKLILTGAEAVRFVKKVSRSGLEARGKGLNDFTLYGRLVPKFEGLEDDFSLGFHFYEEGPLEQKKSADPWKVLEAWNMGEPLVPLLDGGYAEIPRDWLEKHGEKLLDLLAARDSAQELNKTGKLPRSAWPLLAGICEDLKEEVPANLKKFKEILEGFSGLKNCPLPKDLRASLRSYQREGIHWLYFLKEMDLGAMLADDMGLGKTLQAISVINGKTLVVAPTSVISNWEIELTRFRPALRFLRYHGGDRSLAEDADVTITSYAILRLDKDKLASQTWDMIILDEAQNIKNPDSQVAQAAYELNGKFKLILTGTPVENKLEDLWSQFNFINPGLLGNKKFFQGHYVRPISAGSPETAAKLRQRIKPFLLRRLKKDVAPELPPRTELTLYAELSPEEWQTYEMLLVATRKDLLLRLQQGGSVIEALEILLRLRQACCHQALVPGKTSASSAKFDLLGDALETAQEGGHKALVFSQWTSLLDLLEPILREKGFKFLRLDGSTRNRAEIVEEFQSNTGPPLLIMSLKAGGLGLNLTAADYVYILDPWWNPAAEDQAADRIYRIGQEKPVFINRIVALNTIEEKILELQRKKRDLSDAALGGGSMASSLTKEDLLNLLS